MNYSPADVIRYLLIAKGVGSHPENKNNLPWPIAVSRQPDDPDESITVYNTAGVAQGRIQFSGEQSKHPGIQCLVKSIKTETGYDKALQIERTLNEQVYREIVTIARIGYPSDSYLVHSLTQRSQILPLGQDRDNDKAYLHTVNFTAVIYKLETGT